MHYCIELWDTSSFDLRLSFYIARRFRGCLPSYIYVTTSLTMPTRCIEWYREPRGAAQTLEGVFGIFMWINALPPDLQRKFLSPPPCEMWRWRYPTKLCIDGALPCVFSELFRFKSHLPTSQQVDLTLGKGVSGDKRKESWPG